MLRFIVLSRRQLLSFCHEEDVSDCHGSSLGWPSVASVSCGVGFGEAVAFITVQAFVV